jgi:hypothetical protein
MSVCEYELLQNKNNYQSNLKKMLEVECESRINYSNWYDELGEFRKQLGKYLGNYDEFVKGATITEKQTLLNNGHCLDHHVMGYYAPLDFQRIGFGAQLRTPSEQISLLSKQFSEHGIRFIYLSLPCKLAVYPELAVDPACLPVDKKVIPQWRKMIYELVGSGVEVVDFYNYFLSCKNEKMLYNIGHHISPYGAEVIAHVMSDYLKNTMDFSQLSSHSIEFHQRKERIIQTVVSGNHNLIEYLPANRIDISESQGLKPYLGNEIKSEVLVFGNCNLNAYIYYGAGIHANLSYHLNYPIEYGGRFLPFCQVDRVNKMPKGLLKDKKVVIYVGFPSGSFVRSRYLPLLWNIDPIPEDVFN